MNNRDVPSFCRTCGGLCGVRVTIEDDRIASVRGDKSNPLTQGFACIKGLQAPAFHYDPDRLLQPLKRMSDGSYAPIDIEQALDEIAEKVGAIIEEDGPQSIATFRGTQNYTDSAGNHMLNAWMQAIGSPSLFSTMTIDQSAKWVTADRLGSWAGGYHNFLDSDVWMFVGINPIVSMWGGNGFPPFNPVKKMKEARARGMKIIVIDPRRTETASYADIFLQLRPGEDATLAAGLLHVILERGWHDADFCAAHVAGLEALRAALAPFKPDYVARRAGVDADQLIAAAELFARIGTRGICITGTGPNMAARSNLSEHLYECLNVLCGRFLRAGESLPNPGVLTPWVDARAEVVGPKRSWESGHKSRDGVGMVFGEMMSGKLCDEILTPGKGRIRALFVDGGNPALAFPDQRKTVEALRALDLLVTIDPVMSSTAKLSHYVIPPRLQYERADLPLPHFDNRYFPRPYAQFTPALVPPPEGSQVVDDWYVFWSICKRLDKPITYYGAPLDMENKPQTEDLLAILSAKGVLPFEELSQLREGKLFDLPPQEVAPARPDHQDRFDLIPADVRDELTILAAEPERASTGFTHHLISRRIREVQNSSGRNIPAVRKRITFNPAFLHPDDLIANGLVEGDRIEIRSSAGVIVTPVKADDSVRPGAISMTHGWGGLPDEPEGQEPGVATSLLVASDRDIEPINAMPVMSAIPVSIRRVESDPAKI